MEIDRFRSKQYARTPEGKQKQINQKRRYLPVVRHIDAVLKELITDDELLSFEQISDRVYKSRKVKMKPSTIESRLRCYFEKYGDTPLEKVGDSYMINPSYYKRLSK